MYPFRFHGILLNQLIFFSHFLFFVCNDFLYFSNFSTNIWQYKEFRVFSGSRNRIMPLVG